MIELMMTFHLRIGSFLYILPRTSVFCSSLTDLHPFYDLYIMLHMIWLLQIKRDEGRIEKWILRNAFDDEKKPYLPKVYSSLLSYITVPILAEYLLFVSNCGQTVYEINCLLCYIYILRVGYLIFLHMRRIISIFLLFLL